MSSLVSFLFFFQAEDGIRDGRVTGVQTCALPIYLGLPDLVVVAPDAGRVKLNKKFASKIGAELAILDKERPAQQVAEIGYVIGDVQGKNAVIVDDMIDTAGTLKAAAKTVLEAGAATVYAAATHAVFSGEAFDNLRTSG